MGSLTQRLLDHRIPDTQQSLRPQDAAFYALSIGFGQDPLHERELAFVDPACGPVPVPSMALVLAYPGFWLGESGLGLDAARIAHVEQALVLHRPLPTAGTITGHTRVTGVFSRGPGRGLSLASERVLSTNGQALATLRQLHFLRGDQCSEAPPEPRTPDRAVPSGPPASARDLATRPEQALYYRLNGDRNPLHTSPAVASRAGFPRPILHGMCTFGIVTRAVLAAHCEYRPEGLAGLSMRFRAPVLPGDTLRVLLWDDGALQVHAHERDVQVIDHGRYTLSTTPSGPQSPRTGTDTQPKETQTCNWS